MLDLGYHKCKRERNQREVRCFLKKIIMSALFCISSVGYSLCPNNGLVVGWDPYEPFQMENAGKVTGLDVEIIQAISERLKCSLTYKKRPWKRLLLEIELGEIGITGSASKSADREVFGFFTDPYVSQKNYLYALKKDAAKFNTMTKLSEILESGKKIGVTLGYEYGDEYANLAKDKKFAPLFDAAVDEKTGVAKLDVGRIDAIIMNEFTGAVAVKNAQVKNEIVALPIVVSQEELHFVLSKKAVSPEFFAAFNRELKKMEKEGVIAKIAAKYRLRY